MLCSMQCVSAQLEGAGTDEEFLSSTCTRVLRTNDVFAPAALEAAEGRSAGGTMVVKAEEPEERWVSSTKVWARCRAI